MVVKKHFSWWAPEIEPLVDELARSGIPADATDIYQGRNRVVSLHRFGRAINIKQFRVPHILNRLIYTTLRRSKARRAYEHALRLRNLGFDTPEPLAYIELRHGPLLGASFFISQQLEGFSDLRQFTPDDDIPALADQLGALIARLHDAGVWMKDCSMGNILRRPGPKNKYLLYLVDINRMEFDVTSERKLMSNFDRITDDDRFRTLLLRAYSRHKGKYKLSTPQK